MTVVPSTAPLHDSQETLLRAHASGTWRGCVPPCSPVSPLLVAALLGLSNQFTGAYPILVYSSTLAAGSAANASSVAAASGTTSESVVPMVVSASNLVGACLAMPLMARCRRRLLLCTGCLAMAACLWWATLLEDRAHIDDSRLALAFGAWCLVYEISVGSGYFVVVSDLAVGPAATMVFALGNTVRFLGEFASSFFFLSAVHAMGAVLTLRIHALFTMLLALALLVALPETNPRYLLGRAPLCML